MDKCVKTGFKVEGKIKYNNLPMGRGGQTLRASSLDYAIKMKERNVSSTHITTLWLLMYTWHNSFLGIKNSTK